MTDGTKPPTTGPAAQDASRSASGSAESTVETGEAAQGPAVPDGDGKLRLTGPEDQQTKVGGEAKFSVKATGGSGRYSFAWQEDGRPISDADQAFYTVSPTRRDDDGRTYKVVVTDAQDASRSASGSAKLTVETGTPAPYPESPAWWSNHFAIWAAVALILVFVMLLWPVKWSVDELIGGGKSNLAAVIAMQLVAVGLLAMLGGLYLAVLEVRGRSVTYHQLRELLRLHHSRGERVDQGDVDLTGEIFRGLPDVVRAFGQLRAPAAALILAAVCLLAATALAWQTITD